MKINWWPFGKKKANPIVPRGTRKERIIGRLEAELDKPGISEHRKRQLRAVIELHKKST